MPIVNLWQSVYASSPAEQGVIVLLHCRNVKLLIIDMEQKNCAKLDANLISDFISEVRITEHVYALIFPISGYVAYTNTCFTNVVAN
jgi:hypothetical protein